MTILFDRVRNTIGKRKGKAASLPGYTCTFYPDVPSHCFNQLFTDVQPQPCSSHRANKIAFEAHKFSKKHRSLQGWNSWASILHRNAYELLHTFVSSRVIRHLGTYYNRGIPGGVFEGIGKKVKEHLVHILLIGPNEE